MFFRQLLTLNYAKLTTGQARRQDLAAGGGQKPGEAINQKGGHIFKIQYWMYAATGGPNVKWGGTDFKWGDQAPLAPPAGDGPATG